MPTGSSGTGTSGTSGSGTPTPTSTPSKWGLWLKRGGIATGVGLLLFLTFKSCTDNTDERIEALESSVDRVENNIAVLDNRTQVLQANDSVFQARQRALEERMGRAEGDIRALNDSIDVHRAEIDSLRHDVDSVVTRVDTIAARQEKCPCINPAPKKKPAQRPSRPNNVPVRRDTVVVLVKETPVQNANGCGDDQNANVVIHGNNNTVNISNNGNAGRADTTKTVTRRVTATANATLVVNTVVTRNSYCK